MSEKQTDADFIISARKACANSIRNTATGAYLDDALHRLERATALIDGIFDQVARNAQVSAGGVKHVGRIYAMIREWEQK